jgi:uncharacterized Zn finger protein (UPF0148 family)
VRIYLWTCRHPGCGALVVRHPGEVATCPRCGDPIDTDLRAKVEAERAAREERRARRKAAPP